MSDDQGSESKAAGSTTQRGIPTWQRIIKSAEIVGLGLAVLGIVFAWWHVRDLERIEHSISTRSIGSFPDFVGDIEATVKGAKRSLIIACDFPAYGEFDGKGLAIQKAIQEKLKEQKDVQLTFFAPDRRDAARRAQFPKAEWNDAMKGEQQRHKILAFMQTHGYNKPDTPVYEDFISVLRGYDSRLLRGEFQGAVVREVTNDMPLFFWIADDREAVLVAQTPGGHEDSAFFTRDAQLITALKSIATDYRQSALPCPQPVR